MAFSPIYGITDRHGRSTLLPYKQGGVEGLVDDGSTLTLNFTNTTTLDPRLTFSRGSNATLVNSEGFIMNAPANMVPNSVWDDVGILPARWNYGGSAGASDVSIPTANTRRVTNTNTANQYFLTTLGSDSLSAGLTYYAQVQVTEVNGTIRANQALSVFHGSGGTSNPAAVQYVINGVSDSTGTSSVQVGTLGYVFTVNAAGSHNLRLGSSTSGANSTATGSYITFTQPHLVLGSFGPRTSRYYPNSNTTSNAGYYAPRFDYDQTTRAPRGLLVEGQAVNVAALGAGSNSNTTFSMYNTGFSPTFYEPLTLVEGIDGINGTAASFTVSANGFLDGRYSNFSTGVGTFGVTSGQVYTASFYYKFTRSGTPLTFNTRLVRGGTTIENPTTSIDVPGPNGFTRRIVTFTAAASTYGVAFVYGSFQTGDVFQITGMQVELGSGASSYIPTGASQGTRNADNCSMYDTTTSGSLSWFKTATQGTFYVEAFKRTAGTTFGAAMIGTRANSGQDWMLYQAVGNNWLSLNWGASEYVTNYSALSSPFLIKAAVAFSPRTGTPTVADSLVSINGANSALNTTPNVALPFSSDLFCVGARGSANGTVPTQNYAEVAIRRIKFFPTAMTAAQLNAMTTL